MAEILIKAKDFVNPDPELDKFAYKRGHVVCVMPDGHPWGKKECLPDFVVLKVPDMTIEEAQVYLEEKNVNPRTEQQKSIARRSMKLDIDHTSLSKTAKNSLKNKGVVNLTRVIIKGIEQVI